MAVVLLLFLLCISYTTCDYVQEKDIDIYVYSTCNGKPDYELQSLASQLKPEESSPLCSIINGNEERVDIAICDNEISGGNCGQDVVVPDEVINLLANVSVFVNEKSVAYSCEDVFTENPSASSGIHTIYDSNLEPVQVYCASSSDTKCGGEGGWMRIAHINMSEPGTQCPTGLTEQSYINLDHNVCGRAADSQSGCDSVFFSTNGFYYSKVCGQMRGYQYHSPDAFQGYLSAMIDIDGNYVCGYSITYGSNPRKHLWTYAGGVYQNQIFQYDCPCNQGYSYDEVPPPYVGEDYYCESGLPIGQSFTGVLYADDMLWDGENCLSLEETCCINPDMPWFHKTLDATIVDDIEVRLCAWYGYWNEDTPFDILELYVK